MDLTYIDYFRNNDFDAAMHDFFFDDLVRGGDRQTHPDDISVASSFLGFLANAGAENILSYIVSHESEIKAIAPNNIPQFSSFDYSISSLLDTVQANPDGDFVLYGYFNNKESKEGAQRKYGENHYKMASYLGLVTWSKPYVLTPLGNAFLQLDNISKNDILSFLILRIPVIQKLFVTAQNQTVNPCMLLSKCLSKSTVLRRRSNVKTLVNIVCDRLPEGTELKGNFDWSDNQ